IIRRPPRSTLSSSSAASDVYKRQAGRRPTRRSRRAGRARCSATGRASARGTVSYTHLRAHETPEHLVCRLLLEKKKKKTHEHHKFHSTSKSKKQKKKQINTN